jgi:hypothetical protein
MDVPPTPTTLLLSTQQTPQRLAEGYSPVWHIHCHSLACTLRSMVLLLCCPAYHHLPHDVVHASPPSTHACTTLPAHYLWQTPPLPHIHHTLMPLIASPQLICALTRQNGARHSTNYAAGSTACGSIRLHRLQHTPVAAARCRATQLPLHTKRGHTPRWGAHMAHAGCCRGASGPSPVGWGEMGPHLFLLLLLLLHKKSPALSKAAPLQHAQRVTPCGTDHLSLHSPPSRFLLHRGLPLGHIHLAGRTTTPTTAATPPTAPSACTFSTLPTGWRTAGPTPAATATAPATTPPRTSALTTTTTPGGRPRAPLTCCYRR